MKSKLFRKRAWLVVIAVLILLYASAILTNIFFVRQYL